MPISGKLYLWGERAKYVQEEPGVYALYNKDETLIFLGSTPNLREVFSQFVDKGFSSNSCKAETKYYRREFNSEPESRIKELLDEYVQGHGKLPSCNASEESSNRAGVKRLPSELAFHFYENISKPLHEAASNLEELREKMSKVPISSLEFHQKRGDFSKWIRDVLDNVKLAKDFQMIDKTGEVLRRKLLDLLDGSDKGACPNCGVETSPVKTWKMAGRPSKTGERLELTIGYYKCPDCSKTFRHVLAKEKIRAK